MTNEENAWYVPYLSMRLGPTLITSMVAYPILFSQNHWWKQYWAYVVVVVILIPPLMLMISASYKHIVLRQSLTRNVIATANAIDMACPNATMALRSIMYSDTTTLEMRNTQSLHEILMQISLWLDKYTIDINRIYPVGATVLSMLFLRRFIYSIFIGVACLLCSNQ